MTTQEIEHADSQVFPWREQRYAGKRAFDVTFSLVVLLLVSPVMLVVGLAVKLTSSGPILYRGKRAGLGGRTFDQFKFRSMFHNAGGARSTGPNDPRVTPVGRVLRITKLDELPQLVNVLRGEMSVVGPRPEDASVVKESYTHEQLRVLSVRPGLACEIDVRHYPDFCSEIPQDVDADEYYRSAILPMRLEEDLEYIDRMTLWLDVEIIVQTAYCILIKSWFIHQQQRKKDGDRRA